METETIQQQVFMKLQKDHYMKANHIHLVEVDVDCAKLRMRVADTALNGFGYVHGGALFGLADTAAGVAAFTDGRSYVTQSGDFHFIGNVTSGEVFAEARVIHRGRTLAIVEVKVFAQNGKLLGNGIYDMFAVNMSFSNV